MINTVTCPFCGANATNLRNCEYCGSLFVRYTDDNVQADTDSLFDKDKSFTGFIFSGLEEELRKNISLQTQESFIVTDVKSNEGGGLQIVQSSGLGMTSHLKLEKIPSFPGVSIHIPFWDNDNDLESFLKLEESALFTKMPQVEDGCDDYVIDFGNDAVGAAYLASLILEKVTGIPNSSVLSYSTSDYQAEPSPSNSENGSWCFIATATMGSYDHPEVMELRKFRDNWLLKKPWGKTFTKYYYRYGSYSAKFIENNKLLKDISYYFIIKPLLFIVRTFT